MLSFAICKYIHKGKILKLVFRYSNKRAMMKKRLNYLILAMIFMIMRVTIIGGPAISTISAHIGLA